MYAIHVVACYAFNTLRTYTLLSTVCRLRVTAIRNYGQYCLGVRWVFRYLAMLRLLRFAFGTGRPDVGLVGRVDWGRPDIRLVFGVRWVFHYFTMLRLLGVDFFPTYFAVFSYKKLHSQCSMHLHTQCFHLFSKNVRTFHAVNGGAPT